MLDLGNYIESILKKNNKNKMWLCETLSETFYTKENAIAYKTFLAKLSNNTLSAVEFLQIAYILDIKTDKIKNLLKNKENNKRKGESNMNDILKKLILSSRYYGYKNEFEILQGDNEQEYLLLSYDLKMNDFASIESFSLKNNKTKLLGCIKNFKNQLISDEKSIEDFRELSTIDKFHFVKSCIDIYYSLYPNEEILEENFILGLKRNYMNTPRYIEECVDNLREIICRHCDINLIDNNDMKQWIESNDKINLLKNIIEEFLCSEFMKSADLDMLLQYHVFIDIAKNFNNNSILNIILDFRKQYIEDLIKTSYKEEIEDILKQYKEYNIDKAEKEIVINLIQTEQENFANEIQKVLEF